MMIIERIREKGEGLNRDKGGIIKIICCLGIRMKLQSQCLSFIVWTFLEQQNHSGMVGVCSIPKLKCRMRTWNLEDRLLISVHTDDEECHSVRSLCRLLLFELFRLKKAILVIGISVEDKYGGNLLSVYYDNCIL